MKKIITVFALIILICACFVTCEIENPIMEKWWPEPEDTSQDDPVTFYTVEFDAKGGIPVPGNQKIAEGGKVGKVPPMSREGYGFGGWYTDENCSDGNEWNFATETITASVIDKDDILQLYAKWSASYYTVTFDTNGGRPKLDPQLIAVGGKIVEPTALRKAVDTDPNVWFGFGGWYTDDETFAEPWDFAKDSVNTNVTLYAKWTSPPPVINTSDSPHCSVTFEANGGMPEPDPHVLVLIGGSKVVEPPAMVREGYGFGGWYTDSDLTVLWNFATDTVSADLTLYAKWALPPPVTPTPEPPHRTVTFEANGGTPEPNPQILINGSTVVEPPAMSRQGYGFSGWWYNDGGLEYQWNFAVNTANADFTLYAKWGRPWYTVTFDTNGGRPKQDSQLIAIGEKIVQPEAVTKEADTSPGTSLGFGGWYTDDGTFAELWDFATDTVNADLILYAKWSTPGYTVTFNANGGTPEPDPQELTSGSKIAAPVPMSKGSDGFGGWYTTDPDTDPIAIQWNFATDTINTDLILYAKWASPPTVITPPDPPHYTVTFDAKGGQPQPDSQVLISGSKIVKPPVMIKGDDGFDGWWYDDGGVSYQWNFAMYPANADLDLYAKWSVPCYTVTFNAKGGEPPPREQIIAKGGAIVEPPAMVREGYGFGGWYTDSGLTRLWNFATDTVDSDLTLYARWSDPPAPAHCSVTFDADGGTPEPRPQDLTGGSKVVEPYALSREGYGFGGWYTDPGLTVQWDFASDTVSDAPGLSYLTLYAKWITVYFTVTFDADGGSPAPRDQIVAYGTKVTIPSAMRKPHKGFFGWYTDSGYTTEWNFDTPVYADMTLYAQWGDERFTVIFDSYDDGLAPPSSSQHGNSLPENQTIADGGKISEPPDPIRAGYCFAGWYTDKDKARGRLWDFDTLLTDDIIDSAQLTYDPAAETVTLYAYWVSEDPNMVWVKKGSFIMGDDHVSGAKPAHKVTISNGFYIGRYPVTQAEFNSVMMVSPAHANHFVASGDTAPVDSVFWDEAVEYCNKLSTTPGLITSNVVTTGQLQAVYPESGMPITADFTKNGYRLPTEAEWEYAARGGDGSPGNYIYAGSDNPDDVGWYNTNSGSMTRPVGTKQPNGLGIYDMSGNIMEWCWDLYDANYYTSGDDADPKGPSGLNGPTASDEPRVRRGGSWNNAYGNIRTTIRNSFKHTGDHRDFWTLGFRIVRGPVNPPSYTGDEP